MYYLLLSSSTGLVEAVDDICGYLLLLLLPALLFVVLLITPLRLLLLILPLRLLLLLLMLLPIPKLLVGREPPTMMSTMLCRLLLTISDSLPLTFGLCSSFSTSVAI